MGRPWRPHISVFERLQEPISDRKDQDDQEQNRRGDHQPDTYPAPSAPLQGSTGRGEQDKRISRFKEEFDRLDEPIHQGTTPFSDTSFAPKRVSPTAVVTANSGVSIAPTRPRSPASSPSINATTTTARNV